MPAFQNSGKQIKEPSEFLANGIDKTVKLLPSAPRAFYRTLIIKIAEKKCWQLPMIRKHNQLDLYRSFHYFKTKSSFKIKSLFASAALFST